MRSLSSIPTAGVILAVLCAMPAAGASEAGVVVTTSASGRYEVRGPDSAVNVRYTRWAEDVTARLERVLGIVVPRAGLAPVVIRVERAKAGGASVESCCRHEGTLRRELVVNEAFAVDYGALREHLCGLALAGAIAEARRQCGYPPGEPPVFPPWFTAGVARNLDRETAVSNRALAAALSGRERELPASEIMRWERLPEGWQGRRALCGWVVGWMLSVEGAREKVVDRLVRQEPLSPEWFAVHGVGVESVPGMDRLWIAWRQRQDRAVMEFGALSVAHLVHLREALDMTLSPAGVGGDPVRLRPCDVVGERVRYPLIPTLAADKIQQIRALTLGRAPELVAVGESYARFFEAVAAGAWTLTVRRRLAAAEAAFDRLERLTRAREAYLDLVEQEGLAPAERAAAVHFRSGLEKGPVASYLDAAEDRFNEP